MRGKGHRAIEIKLNYQHEIKMRFVKKKKVNDYRVVVAKLKYCLPCRR